MKLLITAFGPFQEFTKNPSELVIKAWIEQGVVQKNPNFTITFEIIPVSYSSVDEFQEIWKNDHYDLIVHLGVASNETKMRLEVLAQNLKSGKDIDGVEPKSIPIIQGAQDAKTQIQFSILNQLCEKYPSKIRISNDAGTYLCNYIYYQSITRAKWGTKVLFIHIADFINNSEAVNLEDQTNMLTDLLWMLDYRILG
jgi:pyroglutamyl-peptidase